jgi:ectoine hydroxylase-related dioxygenase (phytanoyl-CoA dioxygenase family)
MEGVFKMTIFKDCRDPLVKKFFREEGYVLIDLQLPEHKIETLAGEMKEEAKAPIRTNPKIFHYNESPRIIEFWKRSRVAADLSLNEIVLDLLRILFQREPIPFSTLNFIRSTEQPMHSDAIHFGTFPPGYLAGAWVALEDIHPSSGPLAVVPKSHKWPEISLRHLGITELPKSPDHLKEIYTRYESFVSEQIRDSGLATLTFSIPRGHCVLWDSNLLHGAVRASDFSRTRLSQVTHYHFEGVEAYSPLYSDPVCGKVARRDFLTSRVF